MLILGDVYTIRRVGDFSSNSSLYYGTLSIWYNKKTHQYTINGKPIDKKIGKRLRRRVNRRPSTIDITFTITDLSSCMCIPIYSEYGS